MPQENLPALPTDELYQAIRTLIESSRTQVVIQVNQALVLTYWQIGKTIKTEVLDGGRAQYGTTMLKRIGRASDP